MNFNEDRCAEEVGKGMDGTITSFEKEIKELKEEVGIAASYVKEIAELKDKLSAVEESNADLLRICQEALDVLMVVLKETGDIREGVPVRDAAPITRIICCAMERANAIKTKEVR